LWSYGINCGISAVGAEWRLRSERRLGEMIIAQKETVGLRGPQHSIGGSKGSKREPLLDAPPTLAEAGIDKSLRAALKNLLQLLQQQFSAKNL